MRVPCTQKVKSCEDFQMHTRTSKYMLACVYQTGGNVLFKLHSNKKVGNTYKEIYYIHHTSPKKKKNP